MATPIKWEEPPARTKVSQYAEFYETLRKNPGKWALYPGKGNGTFIRKYEGFEVTVRDSADDKKCRTYVRFVGKKSK